MILSFSLYAENGKHLINISLIWCRSMMLYLLAVFAKCMSYISLHIYIIYLKNSPMRTLQEQELLKYPWRTGCTKTHIKNSQSIRKHTSHFLVKLLTVSLSNAVHLGWSCHGCLALVFTQLKLMQQFFYIFLILQQPIGSDPKPPPT